MGKRNWQVHFLRTEDRVRIRLQMALTLIYPPCKLLRFQQAIAHDERGDWMCAMLNLAPALLTSALPCQQMLWQALHTQHNRDFTQIPLSADKRSRAGRGGGQSDFQTEARLHGAQPPHAAGLFARLQVNHAPGRAKRRTERRRQALRRW